MQRSYWRQRNCKLPFSLIPKLTPSMLDTITTCTFQVLICIFPDLIFAYRLYDVLAIEPDNGNATFSLGLAYFDLRNLNKSEELFLRTLEIAPNDTGTLYDLGVMLTETGRYSEALEYLQLLQQVKPDHLDGAAQLGTCYLQMKESENARKAFESVLGRDPTHPMALNNLGKIIYHCRKKRVTLTQLGLSISAASSLPNNVHTRRSITLLDQYYYNFRQNHSITG